MRKYSFALMEVMIGLAICASVFGWLLKSSSNHLQKQLQMLKQIEAHRLNELMFFRCLEEPFDFENPSIDLPDIVLRPSKTKIDRNGIEWRKLKLLIGSERIEYQCLLKKELIDKKN